MRFEDLTVAQCRAMIRLTGWASDGEPIGYLESMLPATLLEAIMDMEHLGLAHVTVDWRGSRWWHLTERGRAVRDLGEG